MPITENPSPPDAHPGACGAEQLAPTCLLFDLDGTLADTAPDLVDALNKTLVGAGLAPVPLNQARWWVAGGSVRLIQEAFSLTEQQALSSPWRGQLLEHYAQNVCEKTRLFPGIAQLLRQLDDHRIAWGVVTNKPHRFTQPLLVAINLDRRARVIVSGDTVARAKPDPLPLLYASDQIGIAPQQVIYVGDDLRDITAGKRAKMTTAAVTWGYGPPDDVAHWRADCIISQPSELLNLVGITSESENGPDGPPTPAQRV